jgi:hypothetical protein
MDGGTEKKEEKIDSTNTKKEERGGGLASEMGGSDKKTESPTHGESKSHDEKRRSKHDDDDDDIRGGTSRLRYAEGAEERINMLTQKKDLKANECDMLVGHCGSSDSAYATVMSKCNFLQKRRCKKMRKMTTEGDRAGTDGGGGGMMGGMGGMGGMGMMGMMPGMMGMMPGMGGMSGGGEGAGDDDYSDSGGSGGYSPGGGGYSPSGGEYNPSGDESGSGGAQPDKSPYPSEESPQEKGTDSKGDEEKGEGSGTSGSKGDDSGSNDADDDSQGGDDKVSGGAGGSGAGGGGGSTGGGNQKRLQALRQLGSTNDPIANIVGYGEGSRNFGAANLGGAGGRSGSTSRTTGPEGTMGASKGKGLNQEELNAIQSIMFGSGTKTFRNCVNQCLMRIKKDRLHHLKKIKQFRKNPFVPLTLNDKIFAERSTFNQREKSLQQKQLEKSPDIIVIRKPGVFRLVSTSAQPPSTARSMRLRRPLSKRRKGSLASRQYTHQAQQHLRKKFEQTFHLKKQALDCKKQAFNRQQTLQQKLYMLQREIEIFGNDVAKTQADLKRIKGTFASIQEVT